MTVRKLRRASIAALVTALVGWVSGGAVAGTGPARFHWTWPLDPVPHVVRQFQAPTSPYGPGHRGVDLAGAVAQQVLAIGDGTVSFAGWVAGRGVVVVDHGQVASTYQPVTPVVAAGAPVRAGQPIGFLQLVHSHCAPAACLHLGVRRGATYLDPLSLLGPRPVRLKPLVGMDAVPRWPPTPRTQPAPPTSRIGATIGLAAGQARG